MFTTCWLPHIKSRHFRYSNKHAGNLDSCMESITCSINWKEGYRQLGTSFLQNGFSGQSVRHGGTVLSHSKVFTMNFRVLHMLLRETTYETQTENYSISSPNSTLPISKTGKSKEKHFFKRTVMSTCASCQHLLVNPKEVKCAAIWNFCVSTHWITFKSKLAPFLCWEALSKWILSHCFLKSELNTRENLSWQQPRPNGLIYLSLFKSSPLGLSHNESTANVRDWVTAAYRYCHSYSLQFLSKMDTIA